MSLLCWSHKKQKSIDWYERNCFLWPEFQDWSPEDHINIVVKRKKRKKKIPVKIILSLKTDTPYHIVKEIKEGNGCDDLKVCDWIVAVNEQSTRTLSLRELYKLIFDTTNDMIKLTVRRHIQQKALKWADATEQIEICPPNHTFIHCDHLFVPTGKKPDDKIVVYENKKPSAIGGLERGDELVAINGRSVSSRKLGDINDEINQRLVNGKEQAPVKVTVTFKKMVREDQHQEGNVDSSKRIVSFQCEPDGAVGFKMNSYPSENEFVHIVMTVLPDSAASNAGISVGDRLMSVNGTSVSNLDHAGALGVLRSHTKPSQLTLLHGDTSCNSDEPPPPDDMCPDCITKQATRLPSEKSQWRIDMVIAFDHVYRELDKRVLSAGVTIYAERLGFNKQDIDHIMQKFDKDSGIGAAKEFTEEWGRRSVGNTVGKLREIVSHNDFQRADVQIAIDKWLSRSDICYGCGAVIPPK